MRSTTLSSLRLPLCAVIVAASVATSALAQQPPTPRPAQVTPPPVETPPPPSAMTFAQSRRAVLPQGFSVVLVLGDIQGAAAADDVPPAARKALLDMRDFLPFKSYKLLDAAWLMCCSQDARLGSSVLRGPDDQEYELKLSTPRTEGSQVVVRFTLFGIGPSREVATEPVGAVRTTARRLADLKDRRELFEKQIQDLKKKADVGIAPATDVPKLEVELRRVDREIEDLTAQLAEARAGRPVASTNGGHPVRSTIIDTSFSMDVGETVVVGTSRLKGGSKALIALLTAVPPRTSGRRE